MRTQSAIGRKADKKPENLQWYDEDVLLSVYGSEAAEKKTGIRLKRNVFYGALLVLLLGFLVREPSDSYSSRWKRRRRAPVAAGVV